MPEPSKLTLEAYMWHKGWHKETSTEISKPDEQGPRQEQQDTGKSGEKGSDE